MTPFEERDVPVEHPTSIASLALEKGLINDIDLAEALRVQQARLPLGQILLALGKLTQSQLDELLFEQRIRRGERISYEEKRQHERNKIQRSIRGLRDTFLDAGSSARNLALFVRNQIDSVK